MCQRGEPRATLFWTSLTRRVSVVRSSLTRRVSIRLVTRRVSEGLTVVVSHLADQVHQEQQRSVAKSRQSWTKASVKAFQLVFVLDGAFDFLPVDAEGGIGEHVVESVGIKLVVAERIAQFDAADILPFDQHVAFADRVAFGVQLLAKGSHDRFRI